jgi:hypothetical protein
MNENDEKKPSARTKGRLFVAVKPSAEDLRRAAALPTSASPRRYCWWWRSLSFDWERAPLEGCTFLSAPKPPGLQHQDVPCRRCDPTASVDHYEPREPHLFEDGFAVSRWLSDDQHRRPTGEISYDLVMDDDMDFVEGTYRLDGGEWQVFIFSKCPVQQPIWKPWPWESGVSGIVLHVPLTAVLNMASVEKLLTQALGVRTWERARGPDSMQIR